MVQSDEAEGLSALAACRGWHSPLLSLAIPARDSSRACRGLAPQSLDAPSDLLLLLLLLFLLLLLLLPPILILPMSFETAWGVPPPSLPTPDKGSAKRKRPSADPATKVESASINLEKLMGLMDKEAQQPKPPSGKDLKKAANKKDKPAPAGAPAQQQQQGGPAAKRQKQDRSAPTTGAQQQQQQPKEPRTDGKAEKGKGRGKNKAAKKANAAAAAAGATGGAAPAAAAAALPPHMDVDGPSTSTVPVIALKPLANASPAKPAASAPPTQSPAAGGEQKKSKKAQKKERLAAAAAASGSTPAAAPAAAPSPALAAKKAESKKNVVVLDDEPAPSGSAPAGPADSALTPMQLKMKRKLEGSRFRSVRRSIIDAARLACRR